MTRIKMTKAERHEHIIRRARELASTGKYADYTMIETVLRSEELPEARHVLDDTYFRDELNKICVAATKYIANSNPP